MSRPVVALINSFNGGELSRHMDGRTDHEKYYHGLRREENFISRVQGSAYRRPGFMYVAALKEVQGGGYDEARLISFNYDDSNDASYIIELGNQYCRFYYQRAVVLDGAAAYELVTPWTASQAADVQYLQIGDLMYLVHNSVTWRSLIRTDHTDWTVAAVDHKDGPWKEPAVGDTDIMITPGARTGNNVALIATGGNVFTAVSDIGRMIRLGYEDPEDKASKGWGYGKIDQVTNATTARCDIIEDFGFELISNTEFEHGIDDWSDQSTNAACSISYDAANDRLQIVGDGANIGIAEYAAVGKAGVAYTIHMNIQAAPTNLAMRIGTVTGAADIFPETNYVAGAHTISVTPTAVGTDGAMFIQLMNRNNNTNTVNSFKMAKTFLGTNYWRLGAFSIGEGYPHALCFYEERLVLAKGRWLYGSKTGGKYEEFGFSTPVLADDTFTREVAAPKVSKICWLVGADALLAGTNATEFKIVSGTEGEPLSPTEPIKARPQSSFGSAEIAALQAGGSTLFLDPFGKKIRDLGYDFSSSKFQAVDITKLAEHIFSQKVEGWAYAEAPERLLWGWLEDGTLISCTYVPEEKVFAWAQHPLGGAGAVESLAVIPGPGGSELWAIIRRTINDCTVRYIEYMVQRFDGSGETDARDVFCVDSGLSLDQWNSTATYFMTLTPAVADTWEIGSSGTLTASGAGNTPFVAGDVGKTFFLSDDEGNECRLLVTAYTSTTVVTVTFSWAIPVGLQSAATTLWARGVTSVTGLDHLEGESVEVMADGNSVGPKTVSGGGITLSSPAALIHAGLGYTSLLQPMRLELPVYGQTLQGKRKRIVEATVRFIDTVGGQVCVGDDVEADYQSINPLGSVVGGGAPQLFNGDKKVKLAGGFDKEGLLTVRQTGPYPMTVVCVIPRIGDVEI